MDPWMDAAHRGVTALVERAHEDAGPIQAKAEAGVSEAPAPLPGHGGGAEMPGDVRGKMEAAFGADFSSVRIHEGPQAEAMGALAYTQGSSIHFAAGHYDPGSQRGQELLGHELAHVVQQRRGRVQATAQAQPLGNPSERASQPVNDDSKLEREADVMGARAAWGQPVDGTSTPSADSADMPGAGAPPAPSNASTPVMQCMLADEYQALCAQYSLTQVSAALGILGKTWQDATRAEVDILLVEAQSPLHEYPTSPMPSDGLSFETMEAQLGYPASPSESLTFEDFFHDDMAPQPAWPHSPHAAPYEYPTSTMPSDDLFHEAGEPQPGWLPPPSSPRTVDPRLIFGTPMLAAPPLYGPGAMEYGPGAMDASPLDGIPGWYAGDQPLFQPPPDPAEQESESDNSELESESDNSELESDSDISEPESESDISSGELADIIRHAQAAVTEVQSKCPWGAGNRSADIRASNGEAFYRAEFARNLPRTERAKIREKMSKRPSRAESVTIDSYKAMRAGGGRCEEFANMVMDVLLRRTEGLTLNLVCASLRDDLKHCYVVIGNTDEPEQCVAADAWIDRNGGFAGPWNRHPMFHEKWTCLGEAATSDNGQTAQGLELPQLATMLPIPAENRSLYEKNHESGHTGDLFD